MELDLKKIMRVLERSVGWNESMGQNWTGEIFTTISE